MSTLPIVVEFKETTIEQSEKIVLEKVNFDLVQAEICYIIGKSGSGKSSLLKSIYGEAGWVWFFKIFTSLNNGR